jgi:uncharacterized protein YciI
MSYFAVVREAGPAWIDGGISEQPALADHAAFMDALAQEGIVIFGGPLAGTEAGRLRALLIVNADSEDEIARALSDDPWAGRLRTISIEPWTVFVGGDRLAA